MTTVAANTAVLAADAPSRRFTPELLLKPVKAT